MDFSDIERILELVREHDLAEFELERDGLKLRVRKAGASPTFHAAPMQMLPVATASAPNEIPSRSRQQIDSRKSLGRR
jgi:biotin carboxyl carrier protein